MSELMYRVESVPGPWRDSIGIELFRDWIGQDRFMREHMIEHTFHWSELDDENGPYLATFHYVPLDALLGRLAEAARPVIEDWWAKHHRFAPEDDQ